VSFHASYGNAGQRSSAIFSVLHEGIVGVAVQPALPRFRRCNHRMPAAASVLGGVPIGGRVTAPGDATGLARSKMYPACAHLHAFITDALGRLLEGSDGFEVCTRHGLWTHDQIPHALKDDLSRPERSAVDPRLAQASLLHRAARATPLRRLLGGYKVVFTTRARSTGLDQRLSGTWLYAVYACRTTRGGQE